MTITPQRSSSPVRPGSAAPPRAGGWLAAGVFLGGALFNTLVTLRRPELFDATADLAVLPPYAWAFRTVIRPWAAPLTLALIAFEAAIGLTLLYGRGRAVRLALLGGSGFAAAVIPAVGSYGLVNLPLIVLQAALLRHRFTGPAWRRGG